MLFPFLFLGVGQHSQHGFEICRWELVKGRWRIIHTWSASAVALVVSVRRAPSARCLDKRVRGLHLQCHFLLGLMTCCQAFSDVDPFPLMPASRWAVNRALSAAMKLRASSRQPRDGWSLSSMFEMSSISTVWPLHFPSMSDPERKASSEGVAESESWEWRSRFRSESWAK